MNIRPSNLWLIPACLGVFLTPSLVSAPGDDPETIYSIAHVIKGRESAYAAAAAKAWDIYRKLDAVFPEPHIVARGADEDGNPYFVEIFTWRSADIPDHAPADVKAVWKELEAACEKRGGRPGIDFTEVELLAGGNALAASAAAKPGLKP
jgi:hypothetical protein